MRMQSVYQFKRKSEAAAFMAWLRQERTNEMSGSPLLTGASEMSRGELWDVEYEVQADCYNLVRGVASGIAAGTARFDGLQDDLLWALRAIDQPHLIEEELAKRK